MRELLPHVFTLSTPGAWWLFSAALAVPLPKHETFQLGSMVLCIVPTFLPAISGTIERIAVCRYKVNKIPLILCIKTQQMEMQLFQVDAFSDKVFGGNPAAIGHLGMLRLIPCW